MIKWIIILLIVAAAASLLGMPALAGAAATGARILIGIVLIIFLLIVLGVFAVTLSAAARLVIPAGFRHIAPNRTRDLSTHGRHGPLRQDERHRQRDHRCRHARPCRSGDAGGGDRAQRRCRRPSSTRSWRSTMRGRRAPPITSTSLNSDGSERAGLRQRHALRRPGAGRRDRPEDFHLRDRRRHPQRRGTCRRLDLGRHGHAALRLAGHSAGRGIPRHPHDRAADRPDRRAGAAFALGRLDGQSARHLLGRPRRLVL